MGKILFTKKEMSFSNFRKSPAMKKLLSKPGTARALNEPREQKKILDDMRKEAKNTGGRLTNEGFAKVLWRRREDSADNIDRGETGIIGKEWFGSGFGAKKRYINPHDEEKATESKQNEKSDKVKEIEKKKDMKPNLKGDAHLAGSKSNVSPNGNAGTENKDKPNIYEALRNVKHGND
jgi:hypothetical protein